jgi:hypothetical protein
MPTQSEIERTLVLLYRSNNASDYVNYSRPAGWLDSLPLAGLSELAGLLDHMKEEVMMESRKRGVTLAICGAGACKDDEHDFKGWRDFADGNGGEQICTKCGMGAMAWTLRVGP